MKWPILVLFLAMAVKSAIAFDNDELEIFDLVEEVNTINKNFYEYMEVDNSATTSEIRKAYRRLSLILHPDKNDAEDAGLKFRWLAAIYDVLKDADKRKIYDRVLVEGLPDWRSPVFYYRRMRKIGLAEGLAYVLVIATVFQYFMAWAAYWERSFNRKERISSQMKTKSMKKIKKEKGKTDAELTQMLYEEVIGPRPSVYDLLPFQLYRLTKWIIFGLPTMPSTVYSMYKEHKEKAAEEERLQREEEEDFKRREAEKIERKEKARERKRVTKLYEERVGGDSSSDEDQEVAKNEDVYKMPKNANQFWTDVDLAKLAKLMKKYPVGTPDRWEIIADVLERLPSEVTKMAKKIKDNAYMVPVKTQGITGLETTKLVSDDRMENIPGNEATDEGDTTETTEDSDDEDSDDENYGAYSLASKPSDFAPVEVKTKVKTKGGKVGQEVQDESKGQDAPEPVQDHWSTQQQKALEAALVQFPKGATERWDRIANKVPGKTKEQCILRYKAVAEMVKKKKEAAAANSNNNESCEATKTSS